MTRAARGTIEKPGKNVAAKAALNRAILSAGFGLLRRVIVSKAEEAGKAVVEVNARFSSRECSKCGHVAKENRRRRRFLCVACGFCCHADVQAALVIRRRAQAALMSEPQPAEDAGRNDRLYCVGTHAEYMRSKCLHNFGRRISVARGTIK